jgi:acetyl-CoA C-acetyltransferase/acetyl-CoA acyltransferase
MFMSLRPSYFKPDIGIMQGLTDPVSGLIMGLTAEVLVKEFHITRLMQDEYSLMSHQRAVNAIKDGIFKEEIVPLPIPPYNDVMMNDGGPRENQTMEALTKLKPYFDRHNGTVTVGNSCPLTDGAAALIIMSEKKAKDMDLQPLGFLKEYAYASLEPERMGLGPVYATSKLMDKTGINMADIDIIEMNEAFAAQIIANEKAFPSVEFAKKYLNKDKALGEIDRSKLNVNGGAIALGHPVGMTGTRLVIHVLRELRRRNKNTGLATLCIGGGQGAALLLEVS